MNELTAYFRYEGIYEVEKYSREKDTRTEKEVYKYALQRDDESPAPWPPVALPELQELEPTVLLGLEYN